jgi:hypothetical protein
MFLSFKSFLSLVPVFLRPEGCESQSDRDRDTRMGMTCDGMPRIVVCAAIWLRVVLYDRMSKFHGSKSCRVMSSRKGLGVLRPWLSVATYYVCGTCSAFGWA